MARSPLDELILLVTRAAGRGCQKSLFSALIGATCGLVTSSLSIRSRSSGSQQACLRSARAVLGSGSAGVQPAFSATGLGLWLAGRSWCGGPLSCIPSKGPLRLSGAAGVAPRAPRGVPACGVSGVSVRSRPISTRRARRSRVGRGTPWAAGAAFLVAAGASLAGLSTASWGPGAEGCDLLAGRGLGGPAGVDLQRCRPAFDLRPVRPCAAGASLAGLSTASWGPGRKAATSTACRSWPRRSCRCRSATLSARLRSAARAALCCRCVSSRSVHGLLGAGGGRLRPACRSWPRRSCRCRSATLSARLRSAARAALCCRCVSSRSVHGLLGAGGGRLRPACRSWPRRSCRCRSASCRPGFDLRPVRPCAAGASLAGLSTASWGPGAEGCDLLAGRGLGGPAGVDLQRCRPGFDLRPGAAGAAVVLGVGPLAGREAQDDAAKCNAAARPSSGPAFLSVAVCRSCLPERVRCSAAALGVNQRPSATCCRASPAGRSAPGVDHLARL